jgi:hypothetical protein
LFFFVTRRVRHAISMRGQSPVKTSRSNAMKKKVVSLQPSEIALTQSAAAIYAAYVASGHVREGDEEKFIQRSVQEAIRICDVVEQTVQADGEMA